MLRIGVDFGGTKIEALALDAAGAAIAGKRVPTPATYDDAVAAVAGLVAHVEQAAGARGSVGVGAPGTVTPSSGVMRNANKLYLNGRRFREDLTTALGRPVRLANDANCMALSEAADGAAAGAAVVFGLILGTGCGGGLVIDGKLVEGKAGVAGEIGHVPLPWPLADETPGPACWCGQHGCLETWISGTGLRRAFQAAGGPDRSAEQIVADALAGEQPAEQAFDRFLDRLGRTIAMLCNLVDPDIVVLGGGLSKVSALYTRLPPLITQRVFGGRWDGAVVMPRWGDASGVRGAARLWSTTDDHFALKG